jgi:type II secretory pathway pseudopilin PulG
MLKSKRSAFSLLEIMIVVAILMDLATIALPAFIRSRNMAQEARYVSDLRTAAGAFEMYAAENNSYPAASAAGVTPSGMNNYLGDFPWSDYNAIGGQWIWQPGFQGCTATIVTQFSNPMDELEMADIDTKIDDGVLATGSFREADPLNYFYIVEP